MQLDQWDATQVEAMLWMQNDVNLSSYAMELRERSLKSPEGYRVHDGPKQEFCLIACGEPAHTPTFVITEQITCGRIPAFRWTSVCDIKTGDFVRKPDENGKILLHLILSSSTDGKAWGGYSDRATGVSVAFAANEVPDYPGGVGRRGVEPAAGRQLVFT